MTSFGTIYEDHDAYNNIQNAQLAMADKFFTEVGSFIFAFIFVNMDASFND